MKVLDPGHRYELAHLDGKRKQTLTFVKRKGAMYPGNKSAHEGTNVQEVLRACVDRLLYVNGQIPSEHTHLARLNIEGAIFELEQRAAERHGRSMGFSIDEAVHGKTCGKCGHVQCKGECRKWQSRPSP